MEIRVLMFASLVDLVGVERETILIDEPATVGDALDAVVARFAAIQPMRDQLATAVNMSYVAADHVLADGDELALIPPVSGG